MVGGAVKIAVCLLVAGLAAGPWRAAQEEKPPPDPGDEKTRRAPEGPDRGEKPAVDPALEAVLEALDEKQEALEDLRADFEQKQVSHLLAEPDVSRGKVLYRKGKLLMEWSEPKRIVLLVDEEGILQYFPEERRAERTPAKTDRDIGSLFPGFGQSSEDMKKTYDIRLLPSEDEKSTWTLELRPRLGRMKRLMDRITLWIDREHGVPIKMRIDDPNQKDYMETTFSGTSVNGGVPEASVSLELPEGTRVTTVKGGLPF